MEIGLSIPRIPDVPGLKRFVETAEELGFESVLAGDHIVLPTEGTNQYPYTSDGSFSRPTDEPFLETMTLLGFLAACTSRIKLGSTVIILPYRNPVVQAKMFASLDGLTGGRMICGVGVGWLEKEFQILGLDYHQRGAMTDEFLGIMQALWSQSNPEYHASFTTSTASSLSPNRSNSRYLCGSEVTVRQPLDALLVSAMLFMPHLSRWM